MIITFPDEASFNKAREILTGVADEIDPLECSFEIEREEYDDLTEDDWKTLDELGAVVTLGGNDG
jgi:hypothetical protein